MPIYTYKCPLCGKEVTDLYTLHEPAPKCDNEEAHPGEQPEMKKTIGRASFKI
jgi:predicted nucleic acid-binding Zn ribbon protein